MKDFNGKPQEFVDEIIIPALQGLALDPGGLHAPMHLLLGTALHESHLIHRVQLGGGPARGLFQMEGNTHDDIWANFLAFRADLAAKVRVFLGADPQNAETLRTNDLYAAAMTRVHYRRMGEIVGQKPIPPAGNIPAMAQYWKTFYNTVHGAGTTAKFIADWDALHGSVD